MRSEGHVWQIWMTKLTVPSHCYGVYNCDIAALSAKLLLGGALCWKMLHKKRTTPFRYACCILSSSTHDSKTNS